MREPIDPIDRAAMRIAMLQQERKESLLGMEIAHMLRQELSGWEPNARLREAAQEAEIQIRYLHEKFGETGSGNAVLVRLHSALADVPEPSETGVTLRSLMQERSLLLDVLEALNNKRPNGERILDWMYEVLDGAQDGAPDATGVGKPATVWTPYLEGVIRAIAAYDAAQERART